jgi:hypothetical protein
VRSVQIESPTHALVDPHQGEPNETYDNGTQYHKGGTIYESRQRALLSFARSFPCIVLTVQTPNLSK